MARVRSMLPGKETRKAFKARLLAEGRWIEAKRYREALRKSIASDYPDRDPKQIAKSAFEQTRAAFPATELMESPISEAVVSGSGVLAESPIVACAVESPSRPLELSESEREIERIQKAEKPTGAKAKLLAAALKVVTRLGIQADVDWVYQNLDIPWDRISVGDVPSPGAVALLGESKTDKKWFLGTYHAKLLPAKSKIEAEDWFQTGDDGSLDDLAPSLVLDAEELVRVEEVA